MSGRPIFDSFSGPPGLIDRMIGEEYAVVKAVADRLDDFAEIIAAFNAISDFNALMAALTAARDAAIAAAAGADASEAGAAASMAAGESFRASAQAFAAAAAVSEAAALVSRNAAAGSANSATNSAIAAGNSQTASAASAILARDWSTKTSSEVIVGQGFGAKKYAIDAAASSLSAGGSATVAEVARLAAVAAKNQAVAIAGFDPDLYALKTYVKQQTKRSAILFGS